MQAHIHLFPSIHTERCGREVWKEKERERKGEVERLRVTAKPKGRQGRVIRDNQGPELQPVHTIKCY